MPLTTPLPSPSHFLPVLHPQVWLASSLLADSLAVAAQTLLARSLAAGERAVGRVVADSTLAMALMLGLGLTAALALGRHGVAVLFTSDPAVRASLAALMPFVVSGGEGPRAMQDILLATPLFQQPAPPTGPPAPCSAAHRS